MSKKQKNYKSNSSNQSSSGQSFGNLTKPNSTLNPPPAAQQASSNSQSSRVRPEQFSLDAHRHIQEYLEISKKSKIDKNDLNAILRLSQHLRIFGLLSAVGYVNQSNSQENNETRKRTTPVWQVLLGQMIDESNPPNTRKLMELKDKKEIAIQLMGDVQKMADERPSEYMINWRKSLNLSNHWNFWARAYQEE